VNLLEDVNFTPLNKKMSGRSFPDMYGVYIHANIIAMLLRGDFTSNISKWITWFLSFLLCYLHLWFFTRSYLYHPGWFHVFTKFVQLFSGAVLVGISVVLLGVCKRKLEVDYLIAPILLSVDCIYLYDALIKWAAKRFSFRSLFLEAHH
jgi:CHASE2 domain-containing sensor protein